MEARKRSKGTEPSSEGAANSKADTMASDAALAALFTTPRRPAPRASALAATAALASQAGGQAPPAANAPPSAPVPPPSRTARSKRKHVDVAYDSAAATASSAEDASMPPLESPEPASTASAAAAAAPTSKSQSRTGDKAPADWQRVYAGLEEMRFRGIARDAPVDTLGCERLAHADADAPTQRWHTLVSLMLSSQTKDPVTAQAMANLHKHWKDGLTVQNVLHCDDVTLDSLICKVGFHNRKTIYLKQTAAICASQYNGDIPPSLEGLMALPGVGPKMAHLCMQVAWKNTVGIGVDTHVHRISNRLGWVKTNTPEQTRMALQEWLPREYWGVVNVLLVGFGQKVCLPIGPRCSDCLVNSLCPTGRANLRYDKRPDKFYPLPPLKSFRARVEQLSKEDAQVAAKVLQEEETKGGGGSEGVKTENEPFGAETPASSSSAAAAASSDARPPNVKLEPGTSSGAKMEPAEPIENSPDPPNGGRSASSFLHKGRR